MHIVVNIYHAPFAILNNYDIVVFVIKRIFVQELNKSIVSG